MLHHARTGRLDSIALATPRPAQAGCLDAVWIGAGTVRGRVVSWKISELVKDVAREIVGFAGLKTVRGLVPPHVARKQEYLLKCMPLHWAGVALFVVVGTWVDLHVSYESMTFQQRSTQFSLQVGLQIIHVPSALSPRVVFSNATGITLDNEQVYIVAVNPSGTLVPIWESMSEPGDVDASLGPFHHCVDIVGSIHSQVFNYVRPWSSVSVRGRPLSCRE